MNNKLTRPDNLRLPDRLRAAKIPPPTPVYNGLSNLKDTLITKEQSWA